MRFSFLPHPPRRRDDYENLHELFTNFEIQEKISLGNLDLFPIKAELQKAPVNIKTFAELTETGLVFITEVGEAGNVELVSVKNLSDSYVFIADGEALIGAKQNRIAQLSAHSATVID